MVCTSILVYCIDDIDAELWSEHLVLVVVGVRMSAQVLASSTDRILQATRIFRYISLVFRYETFVLTTLIDFVFFNVTQ